MNRSQLLARVLVALGATACHSGPAAQPTTIRVDQPSDPAKVTTQRDEGRLPKRAHGYTPQWQPSEAGAGCTPVRKVPTGFSNPRYEGCPQHLNRVSASVYDALKTPRPPQLGPEDDLRFDETLTARARAEGDLEACCYRRDYPMVYEGRPLRWQGELLLPELRLRESSSVVAEKHEEVDWCASARHEHASSASFVRLVLDLAALAAPRELVLQAQHAAREELSHAALALRLAARGGNQAELGRLALPADLAADAEDRITRLARELLLDAALGEGLAALAAAERARRLGGVFQVEMLRLAEEETRHAVFGWRVLSWLLERRPSLLPLLWGWLEEAERAADAEARALVVDVMRPALACLSQRRAPAAHCSVEARVAAQRERVGHLRG
ncbi:MAG: hypothetical protein R3B89_08535 [Polyangiaceae bacterium]